jgi:hypothetical protein
VFPLKTVSDCEAVVWDIAREFELHEIKVYLALDSTKASCSRAYRIELLMLEDSGVTDVEREKGEILQNAVSREIEVVRKAKLIGPAFKPAFWKLMVLRRRLASDDMSAEK